MTVAASSHELMLWQFCRDRTPAATVSDIASSWRHVSFAVVTNANITWQEQHPGVPLDEVEAFQWYVTDLVRVMLDRGEMVSLSGMLLAPRSMVVETALAPYVTAWVDKVPVVHRWSEADAAATRDFVERADVRQRASAAARLLVMRNGGAS